MATEAQLDDELSRLLQEAPPCTQRSFESITDYIEQRSFTFRMFRNEFSTLAPKKSKKKQNCSKLPNEKQDASQLKKFAMYYVSLPLNRSLFTRDEMKDLFMVYTATEKVQPTSAQIIKYSQSLQKIQAENNEFLTVVKHRWSEDQYLRTSEVKDEVNNYISMWWKNRLLRVRNYPQNYKQVVSVSLAPSVHEVQLSFLNTLLSNGMAPIYHINPLAKHTYRTFMPPLVKQMNKTEAPTSQQYNPSFKDISRDPVAEKLALDNQALVVLTPSILATIMANNPLTYGECWSIPIVIKEYKLDGKKDVHGEHSRKIIYFDKKFAPSTLSAVQKNEIFAKHAIRRIYQSPSAYWELQHNIELAKQQIKQEEGEEGGDVDASLDYEEIPGDGCPVEEDQGKKKKQLMYNLWECKAADPAAVLSKHHKKPFKILIRTPLRGQIPIKNVKPTPDTDYPRKRGCTLLPKLDYQPEYGAQVMSYPELVREWVHVTVRPNSVIHRVRIDPVQGNTIMVESKSPGEIANDFQRTHSRIIQQQLTVIQNLVYSLVNLPPGNYLLNHQIKDHGWMFVYQEQKDMNANSRAGLDLCEMYNGVDTNSTAPQNSPWVPLDNSIITPTFAALGRIPCCFAPVRNENQKWKKNENKATMSPAKAKKGDKKGIIKSQKKKKKIEAAADKTVAELSLKTRKWVPYHDMDAVVDEELDAVNGHQE